MKQEFSLSEYKGYRESFEKWERIKLQLDEAEAALQKLLFEGKPESFRSQKERQVQAVLSGVEPDTITAGEKWREDIQKATERRNLFIYASREQQAKVASERIKASNKICASLLPKYKDIIKKKAEQAIALAEIVTEEKEFLERLSEENIAYTATIVPMLLRTIGDPRDPSSGFAAWLVELVNNKYLEFKLIPKQFREKWYQSSGFQFNGDSLTTQIYSELEYAKKLKAGSVASVLKETRKSAEEVKNV